MGHMEHVLHHGQTLWKLEPKGKRSSSLKGAERSDKSWSELSLDAKAVSSPQWRHSQVRPITNLKRYTTVPFVIIGPLPRLCCLEVLSDYLDPVFCLLDHIWTKQLPLTC